jgi:hypothetical protein
MVDHALNFSSIITFRSQQKTILNAMAVNEDGVLATAGKHRDSVIFFQLFQGLPQHVFFTIVEFCMPYLLSGIYSFLRSRIEETYFTIPCMLSEFRPYIYNGTSIFHFSGDNGSMWFWDWKSGHNFQ